MRAEEMLKDWTDEMVADLAEEILSYGKPRTQKFCEHCGGARGTNTRGPRSELCGLCQGKESALKKRFGITLSDFRAMQEAQEDRCAICRTDEPKGQGTWHVDHCHTSGDVRGLLCYHCNVGMGHFKDDPKLMLTAIKYLEKGRSSDLPAL